MSGRRGSDPVLVVGAAVAALAGGMAAVAVLAAVRDIDRPALVAALVGGVVLLGVLAAVAVPVPATGRTFAGPASTTATPRTAAPATRPAAPAPAPRSAPTPHGSATERADDGFSWAARSGSTTRPEPARGTRQWWTEPTAAAEADGSVVPALDLPEHAAETRIVQCTRCGDERVDIRHGGGGFDFDCAACGHHWSWQAGAPWPVAVVRPRLRRPARPDSR